MASIIVFFVCLVSLVQSYPKSSYFQDEFQHNDYFDHQHHHHYHHDHEDNEISNTLVLSHVIFRHGNRTPDSFQELYPNDPYLNETYYPYGLGQLTNAGKLREYSIGTSLRFRYKSFLNDLFLPSEVEAISTDYNRTKASLELALAGLFPTKNEQIWNPDILWQPVPYNYLPRSEDKVLLGVLCPNFLKEYDEVERSLEYRNKLKKFRKVFNYVAKNSGLNVTTFQHIYNLYFGLSTEEEYGLVLPQWTEKVWPDIITDLAMKEYSVMMATQNLRKLASGYFLKKILADTKAKMLNTNNEKKIYLYSAHENNVAQFLIMLGVFEPHIPNYGAHVIVELHQINGEYGFKVFYQNYNSEEPEQMQIPNCEAFCEFGKFVELFRSFIPDDSLCGN
ncbi:unnamed protein product [Ceutorhynchus assimilis]|uniref:acid phosphatase n=1 Tax=Ceutorhynchus assimilis TaxID=467358 RepID=A0A9N9MG23_9CUCU|nr:unnamed protein product [Ceutorhynchus assimilis]